MTEKLLVPIDLSQEAAMDLVFRAANEMARSHEAEMHLLTVVPDTNVGMWPSLPRGFMDDARDEAQAKLETLGEAHVGPDVTWRAEAVIGPIPQTIVKQAERIEADLIVMASHDPKIVDIVLGSVADRVIRRAHCSVLVVREQHHKRGSRRPKGG